MRKATLVSALIAVAALSQPALAGGDHRGHGDGDRCRGDVEAEVTVPGHGHHAKREAHHAAIMAWEHKVAAKYGGHYAIWPHSKDREVDCDRERGGWECEVEAEPCAYGHPNH